MTVVASKPRTRKPKPLQPPPAPVATPCTITCWASIVQGPDPESTLPEFTTTTRDAPDAEMESNEPAALGGAAMVAELPSELPPVKGPSEDFGQQRFKVIGEGKKVRRCADCTKPLDPSATGRFCTSCESSAAQTVASEGRYVPPSRRGGAYSTTEGMEPPTTVMLTNLGNATEHDVRDAMAAFGSVSRVSVPRDQSGSVRGFAFVTFCCTSAAHAVLGARLCVDHLIWHAKLSEDKPWTPHERSA